MASATKGVLELWEFGGKCRTSSVENVLNYPEYSSPFGVCVGRFSCTCEDWYDSLSCEDILVWRDIFFIYFFFVAKCNLWIHYIAHTFLVSASCLIIAKKIGPDPFHNKYMCSCCCCCCGCTTNWQQKCCFSKAQLASCVLEIFSTFQHKARLFFHRLDRLCCWIMQVDTMNTIFLFMAMLIFWRLKLHCVVLGKLRFFMTNQTCFHD